MGKNIEINRKIYRIQIWDTPGKESFKSITKAYYKITVCVIFIYDITHRNTFENLFSYINDMKCYAPNTINKVLVGHKKE